MAQLEGAAEQQGVSARYATAPERLICGYTEGDLETVFAPELAGLDRERMRQWYNGYSWLGAEKVYTLLLHLAPSRPGLRNRRSRSWSRYRSLTLTIEDAI